MKDNQNLSIEALEKQLEDMWEKAKKDHFFANAPSEEPIWGLLTEESLRDIKENLERERAEVESSENKPYLITPGLVTGKRGKILILNSQIKDIENELNGRIDQ